MSAEETDKTTDDEDWLYGDEGEEGTEQRAADSGPAQPDEDKHQQNGGAEKETVEEDGGSDSDDDDDDDDDDVCVTIGDIKTGGSSQYSAFGATPVNLNIKTDGRTHAAAGIKPKGVDMDALGSINGLPVLDMDVESFEEKPWRKPGADISDYFNYGFNEDTWKVYCDKQRRLRASYEGFSLSSAKIMVQQGRMAHGDKDGRSESSCSLFRSASRKSSGTIDVIGGQAGCISRVEGRRRHNMEGNNIQVLSEPSADAEVTSTKISPFFPPNIPPPPFLPPPNISSTPPLIPPQRIPISVPPPGFPLLPGAPPPPLIPTVDRLCYRRTRRDFRHSRDRERDRTRDRDRERERSCSPDRETGPRNTHSSHCGGYDPPPAPPFPFPPGVYPPIPGWPGVIDSAKAWEYYARQDRERGRDKERERPRERGYEKERDRGRDRERDHSPSSQLYHSEEERLRHRDHGDRGYRERSSREREERHRERRHRDKDEGRHKSSRSSSSSNRRHDSEEGDSHRRHKHKKTKRSREDKGTNEEPSADQENQSEPTE